MSSFQSKVKKIKALSPDIEVTEERGCIVLRGQVDRWETVVKAGRLAVDRKKYYGVINDIQLKGYEPKEKLPSERDKLYDGARPDVLIIGGGLTGCAAARELSRYRLDIMLVEKGADVAAGQSSRNGGAVHVGINYSPSSQKNHFNYRGNRMYSRLAKELDFPFERTGHLMLIGEKWEKILPKLLVMNSKRLHIPGVRYLNREQLLKIEPYAPSWAYGALYMPTGGFTSPYKVNVALAENAVTNGVKICLNTAVLSMRTQKGKICVVETNRGRIYPKLVINAAGVYADVIAEMAGDRTFTIHPRKGTDIILDKKVGKYIRTTEVKSPITVLGGGRKLEAAERLRMIKFALSHENTSKGIAVIHTVDKNMIVGPDVQEIPDREDVTTDKETTDRILREQMQVAEKIKPSDVIAYFAGVRSPTYEEDFQVRKGIFCKNILEAAGIQSPGATAAPAIGVKLARWAVDYLKETGPVERNEDFNPRRKGTPHLAALSEKERDALIKKNPDYGEIVCRCEEISKGEILDVLRSPLPVYTLDAVKRRCRPGMGRCQGGFCSPLVLQILAKERGCSVEEIKKSTKESSILLGRTKEAGR
ncbi:FAD-dependent oxidoreductase [Frisingicoccus sp.]|uniref:FAD-dependent oxidoreductase n=1 Tax=Frisingicoccus sp. TaxID=1918627 RepID=UPI0030554E72